MATLEESYALCRRIARSRARNFYYSFALLPRTQHDAMCAVYAVMRRADDIADGGDGRPSRGRQLEAWREALAASLAGRGTDDPILPAFVDTVRRCAIPHQYFFDLLEGMRCDLGEPVYQTFEELYRYCYQAASVVGMTTVHVLGFESPRALQLAEQCGIAFQLTNILRDVAEDAALGRVYFPEDELRQFGLERDELLRRSIQASDARFQRFMEFQWRRAKAYYAESAGLLAMVRPRSRPALWAMVAIYHGLLMRIRQADYNVLERRIRLAGWRKAWIAARALQLHLDGGIPPFPA